MLKLYLEVSLLIYKDSRWQKHKAQKHHNKIIKLSQHLSLIKPNLI